jgi:hypothetical protein
LSLKIPAEDFVRQHSLKRVLVDEYGFSDPNVYVPEAQFRNCQQPAPGDGGQWAVVSANMIEDSHNCLWLLRFLHEPLAGGSMYAFQLPTVVPPAGALGGSPLPEEYHKLAGMPFPGDARLIWLNCIRDPQQLQPTMDRIQAMMQAEMEKRKRKSNSTK